jgi:poly-gamma-glutamate synthesis protein (capsule biosynthesis protein)
MRKRRNRKRQKRIALALLVVLIISLIASIGACIYVIKKSHVTTMSGEKKEVTITKSFSMIAVGDALIHDGVYKDAQTSKKDSDGYYIYDFKDMLTEIKEVIAPYDLKFYNQETIIGGKSIGLSTYPCFNSPDEIGLDMIDAGFNIVNLATNHTLDRGEKAILYSRNFWKNQDVLAVGSYDSYEDRNEIVIKEVNGISYAVLGYTTLTNGIKVPTGKDYLVNVYDKEQVKKDIEALRDKVDVLIVSMHWGTEYTHTPIQSQKEIATYLSSLGVDVIIGHHPHVVEPIEFIDNTLVIYSLGNFISAQEGMMKRVGLITAFTVTKEINSGETKITIDDVKADLLYTYHNNYKNFKVIPFSHLTDSELKNHEQIYNEYMKYVNPTGLDTIQMGFIE